MERMDLHTHKDTFEGISEAHPKLGLIFVILTPIFGIISIITEPSSLEHNLTIANLIGALVAKFFMFISLGVTVLIYWDKIRVNSKQIKEDIKDKLQKKK